MKQLGLSLLILGLCNSTFAESLECQITSIKGRFAEYLPPVVGDSFHIDTAKKTFPGRIQFINGHLISSSNGFLSKQNGEEWSKDVSTYSITTILPNHSLSSLLISIIRIKNDYQTYEFSGVIQKLSRDFNFSPYILTEAKLDCHQLAKPY